MRGNTELDEPAEGDAANKHRWVGGRHQSARRVPRPSRRAGFPCSWLRPWFNADAGDGFLERIASAARARQSSVGSDKPRWRAGRART